MRWRWIFATLALTGCVETGPTAPPRVVAPAPIQAPTAIAPATPVASAQTAVASEAVRISEAAAAVARAYLDGRSRGAPTLTVLQAARPLEGRCAPASRTFAGYEGRPVSRCTYTLEGLPGVAYMLNADSQRIASWVGLACADISSTDPVRCGRALASNMIMANGAQFVVAGVIVERENEARDTPGPTNDPIYLEFRDGVTVEATALFWQKTVQTEMVIDASLEAPVRGSRNWARIANANRNMYRQAGGTVDVGTDWRSDPHNRFLEVSCQSYLAAWDTGSYSLLIARARWMKAAGEIS